MLEWAKLILSAVYDRPMRSRVMGYRPSVICLIQSTDDGGKFLFISPTEKPNAWMPPQEGVEPNESIEKAAARGLKDELGIPESQIHFRRSVWLGKELIPEQRGERDVKYSTFKMKGKAYYAGLVKAPESVAIQPNPAEVANHEWLTLEQIRERLETNSERKQRLIANLFLKLLGTKI